MQIPSEDDDATEVDDTASDDAATRTGVESVDHVLDSIDGLDELPVEDHVGVFEAAHERLRGALDAPTQPSIPAALRPDA